MPVGLQLASRPPQPLARRPPTGPSLHPPPAPPGQAYVDAGLLTYAPLTPADIAAHGSGKPQLAAYDTCLARWGARHTWMGFIDVDEFLMFR